MINSIFRTVRRFIPFGIGQDCPACGTETMRDSRMLDLDSLGLRMASYRCRLCRWRGLSIRRIEPKATIGGDIPLEAWEAAAKPHPPRRTKRDDRAVGDASGAARKREP